ncbi:MAG: methyltransferase domain-containing protein [Acidobacteria bacterium]|nr:methyltransferase domain-containing protein [Acidobacteriota bacterium]
MQAADIFSDYDHFAWFYNKYWGGEYSRPALAIFNVLLFPHLPAGCRILDLCCGTGQIAKGLVDRGYVVTGVDGSEAMLRFARENAPAAAFIHADARAFRLPEKFQCVISAFDSLNHVMELDELKMVFRNVHAVLDEEGIFLFDLNLEDESELMGNSLEMVEDDHVCVVRASYSPEDKLKRYDVTMFTPQDQAWRRFDLTLFQRYHDPDEVIAALAECGFSRVRGYDARREFGFSLNDGRMFYFARK